MTVVHQALNAQLHTFAHRTPCKLVYTVFSAPCVVVLFSLFRPRKSDPEAAAGGLSRERVRAAFGSTTSGTSSERRERSSPARVGCLLPCVRPL